MIPFLFAASAAGALFAAALFVLRGRGAPVPAAPSGGLALLGVLLLAGSAFGWLWGILAAAAAAAAPPGLRAFRAARRRKRLFAQLPPFLDRLASTLASGQGLEAAIGATAAETAPPLGPELALLARELRMGRTLAEALDAWAERLALSDARLVATAVQIAQDSGGRLSDALERIAATVRERERLARRLSTLTAQGRMQAVVIGAMPPALALFLWCWEPETFGRFYATAAGKGTLLGCAIFELAGVLWIWKIVAPERAS